MASTSLERLLASGTSDEVVRSMSWKRSVSNGRRLFEVSGQAPSPSKDWIQLKITDKGVIWRKCRISIRGVTLGKSPTPQPSEVVLSYNDFQYDHTMQVQCISYTPCSFTITHYIYRWRWRECLAPQSCSKSDELLPVTMTT